MDKTWEQRRKRVFEIVEVGNDIDSISRGYDFLNTFYYPESYSQRSVYIRSYQSSIWYLASRAGKNHRCNFLHRLHIKTMDCQIPVSQS